MCSEEGVEVQDERVNFHPALRSGYQAEICGEIKFFHIDTSKEKILGITIEYLLFWIRPKGVL